MVAGSKTQEERDGGRLPAGGETLSLLMVMEIKEEKYEHSLLEGKCLLLWHRKMRNRRCTLSWGGGGELSVIVITVGLSSG